MTEELSVTTCVVNELGLTAVVKVSKLDVVVVGNALAEERLWISFVVRNETKLLIVVGAAPERQIDTADAM